MNKDYLIPLFLFFTIILKGQVGIGTTSPAASAVLDIQSTSNDKGILIPRMTQAQRNAISSPATGLMIFQTDGNSGFYFYDGSSWDGFGEVKSVNGNTPTSNGDVTLTFLATQTGDQADRAATASPADGLVHIITGDTASENGKVYIYSTGLSTWTLSSGFTDTDEQDISGSSFTDATSALVIDIEDGAGQTLSLSALEELVTDADPSTNLTSASEGDLAYDTTDDELQAFDGTNWLSVNTSAVTPTLDQITDVGSTTTNGIAVGGLTVNSAYNLPTATGTAGQLLTVSTTTSKLVFTTPATTVTPTLDQVTDVGSTTTNSIEVGGATVTGDLTVNTNTTLQGNTTIGDATSDDITITARLDSDLIPKTNNTSNLGDSALNFGEVNTRNLLSNAAMTVSATGILTLNSSATGTPTISFQQGGTEMAGIGSSTFFVGDSAAGTHYFFPETIATSSKQALVTGQNSNTLIFLDFANLESQSLDDVLSNGEESNRNIFVASLTVSQTANFATGPDDEDIYIGEFGVDNDDVFISARLNTDLKLETDSTYDLGELDKNFARIFSNQIISNGRLSITASNTTDDDIEFIHNGTNKAGINSSTFYIGDRGTSTYYEFPRERPVSVSDQVLTYSAVSSLTWSSLLNLPAGNQEGMSLRWNNSTSNWETASSTLIFSGGVSATTVTATNINIGTQITFSSNATTVPPLNLVANNLNDGIGALRMEGSEPDIYLNQNSAGFNTVTFATADVQVNAFGKNSSDDFYITVKDGVSSWKNDSFVINNSSGDLSLGYKLSVTGSSTLSELKVGSLGNDYTLPTTRGTAGEVLTVSTTTNLLSFESTSFGKHYMLAELTTPDTDLKIGDEIQTLSTITSNGITLSGGKSFDLTQGKVYKLTGYVEVSGDQAVSTFIWRINGIDIGKQGVSTSTSTNIQDKFILPSVAFYRATSSASVVLRCVTVNANSGNVSTVNSGSYMIIEEL